MNFQENFQIGYDSVNNLKPIDLIGQSIFVAENYSIDASVWVNLKDCFPNNQIISIGTFALIRSLQNFLVFVNFSIIFINYALIFAFVQKRRKTKMQKLNHYRNILKESQVIKIINFSIKRVSLNNNILLY